MKRKATLSLIFCGIGASTILLNSCGADTSVLHFACTTAGYSVVLDDDPSNDNDIFKQIHIYHNSQIVGEIGRSNNSYGPKGELTYYPPSGDCIIKIYANLNETGTITNMKCNDKLTTPILNGEEEHGVKCWKYDFGTFGVGLKLNFTFDCSFTETYH